MCSFTVFVFTTIFVLAYIKCGEDRQSFSFIVALTVFVLQCTFNNTNAGSLNPLIYLPYALSQFALSFEYFILLIVVPLLFGFLGSLTAVVILRDFHKAD